MREWSTESVITILALTPANPSRNDNRYAEDKESEQVSELHPSMIGLRGFTAVNIAMLPPHRLVACSFSMHHNMLINFTPCNYVLAV